MQLPPRRATGRPRWNRAARRVGRGDGGRPAQNGPLFATGAPEAQRAGDAPEDGLRTLALLAAPGAALRTLLLALLLAAEQLVDLADAHARADPPPPTEEALPEEDRPHELWHPRVLLLRRNVEECDCRGRGRERERAYPECCCATVHAPGVPPVDEEAPDEERGGEEEGERRVADVLDCDYGLEERVPGGQAQQLHDGRHEGERRQQHINKPLLELGREQQGKKLDVRDLDESGTCCGHEEPGD